MTPLGPDLNFEIDHGSGRVLMLFGGPAARGGLFVSLAPNEARLIAESLHRYATLADMQPDARSAYERRSSQRMPR